MTRRAIGLAAQDIRAATVEQMARASLHCIDCALVVAIGVPVPAFRRLPAWIVSLALAAAAAAPLAARAAEAPRPASAAPASRLDEILARGVLRVGTTGDYKPFSYRMGTGDFIGLDVELAGD